jgi:hypothetical protein
MTDRSVNRCVGQRQRRCQPYLEGGADVDERAGDRVGAELVAEVGHVRDLVRRKLLSELLHSTCINGCASHARQSGPTFSATRFPTGSRCA